MSGDTLEARLRALEDAEAIRSLKARYLFCCDRKDPAGIRACFADGEVEIDYGPIGYFDNADALVEVYTQAACHPHMVEMHHGANPQIEVLDARQARATWSLEYQLIDTQAARLTRLAGYYEDRYVNVDGCWKIAATRFVATSTLVMDLGGDAAKPLFAGRTPPPVAA